MCVCVWVCVCVCVCVVFVLRAPRTAVYKFVKCRPEGNRANCVTQQSPQMEWSPDLPTKLPPPSSAPYLDAQPVEEEGSGSMSESEDVQPEDGSGYEGSAGSFWMDSSFDTNTEQEMGSGESLTGQYGEFQVHLLHLCI
uniref:Uncharacterized protein n=1 Tax=Hippocampus comes TaxID=109280 RepID=A0A3Q2Z1K4_HIPCM